MTLPSTSKPACGHDPPVAKCGLCRRSLSSPPKSPRPFPRSLPCVHGEGPVSYCALGNPAADVYLCELGFGKNDRVTLGGTCARCDKYEAKK